MKLNALVHFVRIILDCIRARTRRRMKSNLEILD